MQKVRFTFATLAFLGCVFLLALWVRSHFCGDTFQRSFGGRPVYFHSGGGVMTAGWLRTEASEQVIIHDLVIIHDFWITDSPPQFQWRNLLAFDMSRSRNLWISTWSIAVPHWFIAALFGLAGFWFHRRWRKNRPMPEGICPVCGYDLRATPARCPECGHEPMSQDANITAEGAGDSGGYNF